VEEGEARTDLLRADAEEVEFAPEAAVVALFLFLAPPQVAL
jgi:hypothetical protein